MSTKPQCRLTLYLAPAARRAVILRRGPSKWFHLILWHMQSDEFEHGSWFSGRIYEDKCRLSNDGNSFSYFAANQSRSTRERLGANVWSAVCTPPWLKAKELYPSDCGTYGGTYCGYQSPVEVPGADWSGIDHKQRVVYTIGGKLWRCSNTQGKVKKPVLIADFSDLVPPKRDVKTPQE